MLAHRAAILDLDEDPGDPWEADATADAARRLGRVLCLRKKTTSTAIHITNTHKNATITYSALSIEKVDQGYKGMVVVCSYICGRKRLELARCTQLTQLFLAEK